LAASQTIRVSLGRRPRFAGLGLAFDKDNPESTHGSNDPGEARTSWLCHDFSINSSSVSSGNRNATSLIFNVT
jgi:hypothetical protein